MLQPHEGLVQPVQQLCLPQPALAFHCIVQVQQVHLESHMLCHSCWACCCYALQRVKGSFFCCSMVQKRFQTLLSHTDRLAADLQTVLTAGICCSV